MFFILEMQTTDAGTAFLPIVNCETRREAESTFYYKCASACQSDIMIHTIITFLANGEVVSDLTKCFRH